MRRLFFAMPVLLGTVLRVSAQTSTVPSYTRNEISLGASSQPLGPTLIYDFNLSPSLAIETRLTGLPSSPLYDEDKMQWAAGIKAGIRRGRWDFSGIIEPGWGLRPDTNIQYTSTTLNGETYIYPYIDQPILRSKFFVNTGVSVEYSLTPHTFVRADVLDTVELTPDQIEFNSPELGIIANGIVQNYGTITLSAGHRFGHLLNEPDRPTRAPHIEAGGFFPIYSRTNLLFSEENNDHGYGGWISASVASHLDMEAAAVRLPRDDFTRDYQDGGQQTLALGGIKSGFRKDRVGIFLKVRSGAIRFSHTFAGSTYATLDDYLNDFEGHPTWQPALDLGGVVEVYPVRHIVLRAEAGPTVIFYRATTFGLAGQNYSIDASHASSLLLLFGAGFRF